MEEVSKKKEKQLHISVRNLVEFIFREGDIDSGAGRLQSADAMLEGSKVHRMIQGKQEGDYQAEVPLRLTIADDLFCMTIDGRADGIFTGSIEPGDIVEDYGDFSAFPWIDEIKGVYRNVHHMTEPVFVHKAQAMCYAYIYGQSHDVTQMGIQMTYCNMDTKEIVRFRYVYAYDRLAEWFEKLWLEYRKWAVFECTWKEIRQASIQNLAFPFTYREGQKKLVGDVYRTILRNKNLFIQAPTGVGKTVSTIYPAVRAVGEDLADRIFYLTAKTITATVAKETFAILTQHGYRGKVIQITAKEKICPCGDRIPEAVKAECNPGNCPYAKGHFDRINDAIYDIIMREDTFTRDNILEQAEKYMVCPFELSLDISLFCDDIICDYNYVFDPRASLKRFFAEGSGNKKDYLFLVDEAHNLVDRSREMFSAQIYKEDFLTVKKLLKAAEDGKSGEKGSAKGSRKAGSSKAASAEVKICRLLDKCNKALLEYKRECEKYQVYEDIGPLLFSLERLASELDEYLQEPDPSTDRKNLLDFYFQIRTFLNIYELLDEHYVIYSEIQEDGRFMMKLFCVDPSANLQNCLDKARSTVFFSATMLPIVYYKSLLSTIEDNYAVYAHSTFDPEKRLLLLGRGVSTKYTRRTEEEFDRFADYIYETVSARKGNYMVFFPSYKLMQQIYDAFLRRVGDANIRCILQTSGMNEAQREAFLQEFDHREDYTLAAFCVMGGIFGEGIDLKEEKLIGALIIGTGLPQVSNEKEILRVYYEEHGKNGFDYAYRYPGMNKVLQAAGRVIRTEEDTGVIVLLDERFLSPDYAAMFPREWANRKEVGVKQVQDQTREFWRGMDVE